MTFVRCTTEQKIEVLTYARDNGILAASKKYHHHPHTIAKWNRELKIYSGRTPLFRTLEQKTEIVEYSIRHGRLAAMEKYNVSYHQISDWKQQLKIGHKINMYSIETRNTVIKHAEKYGIHDAVNTYHVSQRQVYKWLKTYGNYNYRRRYAKNQQEKIDVLNYANQYGIDAAAREFKFSPAVIRKWNNELKIINFPTHRKFTDARKQAILILLRRMLTKLPFPQDNKGPIFRHMYEKYSISRTQLRLWNDQFNLVPTEYMPPMQTTVTDDMIQRAQAALDKCNGSVHAASIQTGISAHYFKYMTRNQLITRTK